MPVGKLQSALGRIFYQRCFYLFVSIVALIAVAPYLIDTERGRVILPMMQMLMLVAAIASLGKTAFPFILGLLLGIPALAFNFVALVWREDVVTNFERATFLYLAFYLVVIVYLLEYVFNPEVMTSDKLFGAAACYLMLGIAWTDAYVLAQYFDPQAFSTRPGAPPRSYWDLLYMSFGSLTSNGTGDVIPNGNKVRSMVILEQITGALFAATLIARLAGIYPPKQEAAAE
ncbi:MAG: ion channel [Burkholderiales bacterium]